MRSRIKNAVKYTLPPRETLVHLSVLLGVFVLFSFVGFGQDAQEELVNTLQGIGDFISLIILGVAVPNGAYGFLQYMTAGSNVDQDEKGRRRIRNTFIGLAGVAVIQGAVEVFQAIIGL
jgi:hypothetical protein